MTVSQEELGVGKEELAPTFFIVGGSKCGSTSLYHYLRQHSDIYMSRDKEPEFFQNDELFERGMGWYLDRYYSGGAGFEARGEASAAYLYKEVVARRIAETLPPRSHHFVVLVRDPVDRAFSQYWHEVRRGQETRGFKQAVKEEVAQISADEGVLDRDEAKYIGRSLFAHHLSRYRRMFGEERLFVLSLRDIAQKWEERAASLGEFLGVEGLESVRPTDRYNVGGSPRSRVVQWLALGDDSPLAPLREVVPEGIKEGVRRILAAVNWNEGRYRAMTEEEHDLVAEAVGSDVEELRARTGRYFADWSV